MEFGFSLQVVASAVVTAVLQVNGDGPLSLNVIDVCHVTPTC